MSTGASRKWICCEDGVPHGRLSDTEAPKDFVQSVARALRILDVVAGSKEPVRAQWIASEVNLHLATTSHLLATLVHVGYLERNERTYKLASGRILELSSRLEQDWRPLASVTESFEARGRGHR
ncbi:helix-turn-helix domain-containing protein [Arthrobacter sp. AG367]|uniref:helix-turn-helix domain-containing protein n=1 Tax=Arthrobacter sp. AG367 TaxID=2572909 RepID=UPI00119F47C4